MQRDEGWIICQEVACRAALHHFFAHLQISIMEIDRRKNQQTL